MKRVDGPARARALLHLSCLVCARVHVCAFVLKSVKKGLIEYFMFLPMFTPSSRCVRFFLQAWWSVMRVLEIGLLGSVNVCVCV